jgi:para-aminobenzoate synthetase component 2
MRNDAPALLAALGDNETGRPALQASVDGVLVSPGPGAPAQAGASLTIIRYCAKVGLPMLGVCLGHQALAEAFGAQVVHAPQLRHGKTSSISHDGTGVFEGVVNPVTATRYHSLTVEPDSVPGDLRITAETDGLIMALAHRTLPLHGVQFHPESVVTAQGHRMLANWLAMTGLTSAIARSATLHP